ncbi:uncharacterized protein [Cherax quadricarinatus]|uniref:uncharacterized protein n=1 Tax=Cherax quadricarinatus TaxID=27406 RepID=UPI002377E173|nr:uncharacterized protein LOC128701180 [Cherax quadricarinatus]
MPWHPSLPSPPDDASSVKFQYIFDHFDCVQVTSLTAEVRRVRQQIEETAGKGAEKDRDSQRTVSQLESEVRSAEEAVEALERELRQAEDTLTEMKTSTQELFDLLQCDAQPIVAIVGGGEITSASVSVYLSVVEQRVHELLQLRQFLLAEDQAPAAALGEDALHDEAAEGRSSSASSAKVVVPLGKPQLPHTAHVNDEEYTNGGPLTHGDLLATMRKFIPNNDDN